MAKVTSKELNECIAEAIAQVIKEDWEDDIVNAALNDKRAKKAFEKDKKKEDDAEEADDEKIAASAASDAAEEGDEEEVSTPTGTAGQNVRSMSYHELKDILATAKRGTAIFRAATRELMDRDAILADKDEILAGELVKPYGWDFDEEGYPYRTHEFKSADGAANFVNLENSNGTNFHWLTPKMDIHGNEIGDKAGVGIPDANWA